MPIEYQGVNIPTSFASCSIGCKQGETLMHKMASIRHARFDGMELAMPDILEFHKAQTGQTITEKDVDAVVEAAEAIKEIADAVGLRILMLQPFNQFEGWDAGRREASFDRAADWLRVMDALGTDMLQVGSSDAEEISKSFDTLAADLSQLAQLCSTKGYKVAYENWCWSTHAPTWKQVWELVKKVDLPNMGLCLDTFQAAGAEFADPTTKSGFIESVDRETLESSWKKSLAELAKTVPADKIFLLQISDAYKMSPPLEATVDADGQPPRARWSHSHRPLPCSGGYLPVQEYLDAVLRTGFRGWLSVEVFDPKENQRSPNDDYTTAAMVSLKKLLALEK